MNSSFEVNVNHCLRICMSRACRTDLSHMAFCEHGQTAPQCPFGRAIHFFRSRDSGCVPSLLCNRCRIHYPEVFFRKNYNTYIPPIIICNGSGRKIFKRLYVCSHVMFLLYFSYAYLACHKCFNPAVRSFDDEPQVIIYIKNPCFIVVVRGGNVADNFYTFTN